MDIINATNYTHKLSLSLSLTHTHSLFLFSLSLRLCQRHDLKETLPQHFCSSSGWRPRDLMCPTCTSADTSFEKFIEAKTVSQTRAVTIMAVGPVLENCSSIRKCFLSEPVSTGALPQTCGVIPMRRRTLRSVGKYVLIDRSRTPTTAITESPGPVHPRYYQQEFVDLIFNIHWRQQAMLMGCLKG